MPRTNQNSKCTKCCYRNSWHGTLHNLQHSFNVEKHIVFKTFVLISASQQTSVQCFLLFVLLQSYKDKKIKENVSGRMEAGMFARYMAIAIVNELDECWISPQPVLLITYASQYMPTIFNTYVVLFYKYMLILLKFSPTIFHPQKAWEM